MARFFQIKIYLVLPNARITAFTVLELSKENHWRAGGKGGGGGGGGGGITPQARFVEVAVIYFTKIFFTFFYFSQTLDWKFFGLTYILE